MPQHRQHCPPRPLDEGKGILILLPWVQNGSGGWPRISLVLVKNCIEAQVLLHLKGSALRGCLLPAEAKIQFFFFLFVLASCLTITENQLQNKPLWWLLGDCLTLPLVKKTAARHEVELFFSKYRVRVELVLKWLLVMPLSFEAFRYHQERTRCLQTWWASLLK